MVPGREAISANRDVGGVTFGGKARDVEAAILIELDTLSVPGIFAADHEAGFRRQRLAIGEENAARDAMAVKPREIAAIGGRPPAADVDLVGSHRAFVLEGFHQSIDVIIIVGEDVQKREPAVGIGFCTQRERRPDQVEPVLGSQAVIDGSAQWIDAKDLDFCTRDRLTTWLSNPTTKQSCDCPESA